jgi:hypothetical protein
MVMLCGEWYVAFVADWRTVMNTMRVRIILKDTVITQQKSATTKCRGSHGSWRDIVANAEAALAEHLLM